MTARKYDFSHLTEKELDTIAAKFPKAVETVRRPVYSVLAKLADCDVPMPDGIQLVQEAKDTGTPKFLQPSAA